MAKLKAQTTFQLRIVKGSRHRYLVITNKIPYL